MTHPRNRTIACISRRALPLLGLALVFGMRSVMAAEVPIKNGDFEAPAIEAQDSDKNPTGWRPFATAKENIGTSKSFARSGKQSAKLMIPQNAPVDGNQGIYQLIPVIPGKTYTFKVYVHADESEPLMGSVRGQLSIEWKDDSPDKKEVDRTWGTDWGATLSAEEWTEMKVTAQAPAKAKYAAVVVTQFIGPSPQDTSGVFYVDDATVAEQ